MTLNELRPILGIVVMVALVVLQIWAIRYTDMDDFGD